MPEDPGDLDDFELEPTRKPGDTGLDVRPYRPPEPVRRGGGLLFPITLVSAALVAVGLLAILFLVFRNPRAPKAAPTPAPLAARPSEPGPSAAPQVQLPPLDASDGFVRQLLGGLSSHPELARWLAQTALVRTLTAVVTNVADGETPRPHLGFLAPKQLFAATRGPGRKVVPDPAGFVGYDALADAVVSVDATAMAGAYLTLEPLFDTAYRDLGHPEGGFRDALDRAIRALLAVPVLDAGVELVPHAIGFRYADPKLERLSAAQKQFLRTGPRNVRLVQGKLREIEAALPPVGTPPPP